MKKIIILNYGLHISGVSRTLVNFANALVNHGYDVTVKIEIPDFTLQSELDSRVKCSLFLKEPHPFGMRIRGFLRFYSRYLKWLLKQPAEKQYRFVVRDEYDIEIAFNRGAAANIISASKNLKSKKLVWVHNDYMKNSNPLAGFRDLKDAQRGYAKFDSIVCVSEQAERSFAQKFGSGYPLTTRYNIMDFERICSDALKEKISTEKFTIVAVGRLSEQKNYKLMLDVIAELNHRNIMVGCWIVGGGELEQELKKYKEDRSLHNVKFWGAQTTPYPYMKCADLYLSTSIYEGLSTTTIEALILGKPCIVTDCTGMKNILGQNNEYGIVTSYQVSEIADKIEWMIENEEVRKHYAEKALERAADFDPEVAFRRIEELF